jgi:hypothetical protein
MDNREFAKLLLCEATELLEGAQAEAYKQKKNNERLNKKLDDEHILNRYKRKLNEADNKFNEYLTSGNDEKLKKLDKFFDEREKYDIPEPNKNISATDAQATLSIIKRGERAGKFNYRKPKSQNETAELATLLTEAALLLNEDTTK